METNKLKKMIVSGLVGIGMFFGSFVSQPSEVEAHVISSAEEHAIGYKMLKSNPTVMGSMRVYDYLLDDIVKANNLPTEDRTLGQKRYLHGVYLSDTKQVNAYSYPAGYIVVTEGFWKFSFPEYKKDPNADVVMHSHTNNNLSEFMLGHEIAHWYNKDYLKKQDSNMFVSMFGTVIGQIAGNSQLAQLGVESIEGWTRKLTNRDLNFKTEQQADETSLKFLEQDTLGNAGGGLVFFHRLMERNARLGKDSTKDQGSWEFPHSSTKVRYDRVAEYVNRQSNGRIKVTDNAVYIDGKLFNVPHHSDRDENASQLEHNLSVAGGLAKAIANGCDHTVFVKYRSEHVSGEYDDWTVILASNASGTQYVTVDAVKTNYNVYEKLVLHGRNSGTPAELKEGNKVNDARVLYEKILGNNQ